MRSDLPLIGLWRHLLHATLHQQSAVPCCYDSNAHLHLCFSLHLEIQHVPLFVTDWKWTQLWQEPMHVTLEEDFCCPLRPQARILLWLPIQSSSLGRNQMSNFHATSAQLRTLNEVVFMTKPSCFSWKWVWQQSSRTVRTEYSRAKGHPACLPSRATAHGRLAQCFTAWAWESEHRSVTRGTANCVTLGKQLTSLCFSFLNGTIGNEILCPDSCKRN